jgi:hypothetical protein
VELAKILDRLPAIHTNMQYEIPSPSSSQDEAGDFDPGEQLEHSQSNVSPWRISGGFRSTRYIQTTTRHNHGERQNKMHTKKSVDFYTVAYLHSNTDT